MRRTLPVLICVVFLTAAATPAIAPVPFRHVIIDSNFFGDCKGVGDIDGDGFLDIVVGGGNAVGGGHELYWYKYPNWTKHDIARGRGTEFTTDMQVADVNGDGAPDILVGDGGGSNNVIWFENPRGRGGDPAVDLWPLHVIGTHGDFVHDLEVGDINGDGKLDVVTRKGGFTKVWLQNAPDSWTMVDLSSVAPAGEGLALAHINNWDSARARYLDIVVSGRWIETPLDPVRGTWVVRTINLNWPALVGIAVGDINRDGRMDVVFAPSESAGGRMAWYEAPPDPRTGAWAEHLIDPSVDFVHTFKTADVNNDGQLDIVFAEMAQSSRRRVGFYLNEGNGTSWTVQILATTGSHNIRVADIGRDGDIDIIGSNWQGPPVEMWENLSAGSPNPVPSITSLAPSSATAGGAAFTMTVNGTNFISGSVVRWNGNDRATTFVSGTQVTATIPASDIATAGNFLVTVFNPAPGGGASNSSSFAITDFTVSALPPAASATAGQSVNFTVTVAPQNGPFPNAVTLTCANLPPQASCSFNPPAPTPNSNPVNSTLTLATTANAALPGALITRRGSRPLSAGWGVLALVALCWAALAWGISGVRRLAVCLPVTMLGALLVMHLAGCGGVVGTNPPPPRGTPPGTYTITITGTSGPLQHSTTVRLAVR